MDATRFVIRLDVTIPDGYPVHEVAERLRTKLAQPLVVDGGQAFPVQVRRVIVTHWPERIIIVHPDHVHHALDITEE